MDALLVLLVSFPPTSGWLSFNHLRCAAAVGSGASDGLIDAVGGGADEPQL